MGPQLRKPTSYHCTTKPKAANCLVLITFHWGYSLSYSVPGLKQTTPDWAFCQVRPKKAKDCRFCWVSSLMMSVRYCFLAKEAKRKQTLLLRGLWTGKLPSPTAPVSHVILGLGRVVGALRSETLRRVRARGSWMSQAVMFDTNCFPGARDDVTFHPSEKERG